MSIMERLWTLYYTDSAFRDRKIIVNAVTRKQAYQKAYTILSEEGITGHIYYSRLGAY